MIEKRNTTMKLTVFERPSKLTLAAICGSFPSRGLTFRLVPSTLIRTAASVVILFFLFHLDLCATFRSRVIVSFRRYCHVSALSQYSSVSREPMNAFTYDCDTLTGDL